MDFTLLSSLDPKICVLLECKVGFVVGFDTSSLISSLGISFIFIVFILGVSNFVSCTLFFVLYNLGKGLSQILHLSLSWISTSSSNINSSNICPSVSFIPVCGICVTSHKSISSILCLDSPEPLSPVGQYHSSLPEPLCPLGHIA